MKIMLVAAAYTKEEGFLGVCNALERMGHEVKYVPVHMRAIEIGRPILGVLDDSRDMEAKEVGAPGLRSEIVSDAENQDLVIFWKGELLDLATVNAVSQKVKTVWYSWDDPYELETRKESVAMGSSCYLAASCCEKSSTRYMSEKTLWLPPGYDPSVHYEDGEPEVDVCFIGTNTYCRELYDNGVDAPFDRRDLVTAALNVTDKVEIWGRGNEPLGWLHPTHGDPSFAPYFKGFIKFSESRKAFSRAKVTVNSHVRRTGYKYFNERTFQIMGCSRPQLIDKNPGTVEVFGGEVIPEKSIFTYDTLGELESRIKEIISLPDLSALKRIAKKTSEDYTWDKFCEKLLEAAK